MLKKRRADQFTTQTMLYRVVFDNTLVKYAVTILFGFLLLQPIAPALASVDEGFNNESQSPQVSSSEVDQNTEIAQGGTESTDLIDAPEVITSDDVADESDESSAISEEVIASTEVSSPDELVENVTEDIINEVTEETTDEENEETTEELTSEVIDEEVVSPTATSTDDVDESVEEEESEAPIVEDTLSTTTEEVAPPIEEEVVFQAGSASAFEFDTKECASVGDGAYYCSSVDEVVDPLKDGIFSAPDKDGDLEIYVRLGGEETVITSNNVDDTAPYYDALGKRIVWHRMVNDRYQIVSYDLNTNEETVLTNTNYNNMEPVAYENMTLWQAWVSGNWEIMMYDGTQTAQLTNNTVQDVSPHMRGEYIVWQTQFKDGWQVAVYDQQTKAIEYIASEGGIKVENPRFVLVYDSTNVQGDIQTVGYDFENKESFTLARVPVELPDELPEPDQTGETRALIQNKQTSREGESEILDIITNPDNANSSTTASTTPTSNGDHTLDLSGVISTTTATTTVYDITDVVIPSYTASTTISQPVIEQNDVVIPPFIASSTEDVG